MTTKIKFPFKTYLLPAVVSLVIGVILIKFTVPQVNQIMEARQALKVEKSRLDLLVEKSTKLERLDETTLKNDVQTTQNAIPSEKDVSGLVFTVDRLTKEASLAVKSFKTTPGLISTPSASPASATPSGEKKKSVAPSKEETSEFGQDKTAGQTDRGKSTAQRLRTSPPLNQLSFELSIEGAAKNVRTFLEKIKKTNPLLSLTLLDYDHSLDGDQGKATIKMLVYYQPLPTTLGKTDDPLPVLTNNDQEILAEASQWPIYSQLPPLATGAAVGKTNPFE